LSRNQEVPRNKLTSKVLGGLKVSRWTSFARLRVRCVVALALFGEGTPSAFEAYAIARKTIVRNLLEETISRRIEEVRNSELYPHFINVNRRDLYFSKL